MIRANRCGLPWSRCCSPPALSSHPLPPAGGRTVTLSRHTFSQSRCTFRPGGICYCVVVTRLPHISLRLSPNKEFVCLANSDKLWPRPATPRHASLELPFSVRVPHAQTSRPGPISAGARRREECTTSLTSTPTPSYSFPAPSYRVVPLEMGPCQKNNTVRFDFYRQESL